ncbi:hypothetical protein BDE02_08G032200 [Populus trichocarpa]|nr:hypothetical protein BDE02_08G032200 [Populus trichocarpa]
MLENIIMTRYMQVMWRMMLLLLVLSKKNFQGLLMWKHLGSITLNENQLLHSTGLVLMKHTMVLVLGNSAPAMQFHGYLWPSILHDVFYFICHV